MGVPRKNMHWVLCLKGFYLFSKNKTLRRDLRGIFISFPSVSFNMLMLQNECVERSGSFSGQFHLHRIAPKRGQA